jgi:hypothetical protein
MARNRKQHKLMKVDTIRLKQVERHCLIGLDDWGLVAEVWQHTDESNTSNEDDIVRVQDDFFGGVGASSTNTNGFAVKQIVLLFMPEGFSNHQT